jgi:hypothetical protein
MDDGTRASVSEFMDPESTIMAMVFPDAATHFPPAQYHTPAILKLFRASGLQSLDHPRVFVSTAQEIAKSSNVEAGLLLLRHFISLWPQLEKLRSWTSVDINTALDVEFIPAFDCRNSTFLPADLLPSRISFADLVNEKHGREERHGRIYASRLDTMRAMIASSLAEACSTPPSDIPKVMVSLSGTKKRECSMLISKVCFAADACFCWTSTLVLPYELDTAPLTLRSRMKPWVFDVNNAVVHLKKMVGNWQRLDESQFIRLRQGFVGLVCGSMHQFCDRINVGLCHHTLSTCPFILFDNGESVVASTVCVDLAETLTATVRAPPPYLEGYDDVLVKIGAASSAEFGGDAPIIQIRSRAPAVAIPRLLLAQINRPALADVTFQFTDGRTIHAHRLILALTSQQFSAMFESGFAESLEPMTVVDLPDWVDYDAFLLLLFYLYSGSLEGDATNGVALPHKELSPPNEQRALLVCNLLRLSDLYLLDHLKSWCESYLGKEEVLTVYTVCGLLSHADICNAPQLLKVCCFIVRKMSAVIAVMPEWQELPAELQARSLTGLGKDL